MSEKYKIYDHVTTENTEQISKNSEKNSDYSVVKKNE